MAFATANGHSGYHRSRAESNPARRQRVCGDAPWGYRTCQARMRKSRINTPATTVVTTATSLRWSWMMPTIPKIRASGNDSSVRGPARAPRGLRQPGLRTTMQAIVAPAMPRNVAAIFP